MDQLKPCPFCGGAVEIVGESNPFLIWCETCGLEFGHEKDYKTYQIVEAWNRRVDDGYSDQRHGDAKQLRNNYSY